MKFAAFILLLAFWQSPAQSIEIDTLGEKVFIGQAYPSGNVYLRPFAGDSRARSFWPESLPLVALGGARPDLPPVLRGTFSEILASKTENGVMKSIYIPGMEGMDEDHESCGLGEKAQPNRAQELISGDFFQAMFDHCETNEGVAVYRTAGSKYSMIVIGVAGNISLASHKLVLDKLLRPLTPSEKVEVDRQKGEEAKNNAQLECSTTPSYLEAAVQIFEASTVEGSLTLRVSSFENPGCAGHLATIYILDVLRRDELLKKFEFFQYRGTL